MKYFMANWKLNGHRALVDEIWDILPQQMPTDLTVAVFPPATLVAYAAAKSNVVWVGAQNIAHQASGALTGEISANMFAAEGAKITLIGHSERRHVFGESDHVLGQKIRQAQESKLTAVLCIGETLEQREMGQTDIVLAQQLANALAGLQIDWQSLIIAYEPVWAIGTGQVPEMEQIAHACGQIKQMAGKFADGKMPKVLYGGSVNPDNVGRVMSLAEVDGVLVGGASLKAQAVKAMLEKISDLPK